MAGSNIRSLASLQVNEALPTRRQRSIYTGQPSYVCIMPEICYHSSCQLV